MWLLEKKQLFKIQPLPILPAISNVAVLKTKRLRKSEETECLCSAHKIFNII